MTLSDRLAEAARRRAEPPASGAHLSTLLAPPKAAGREVTVILGAHIPVAAVEPDADVEADAICPTCGRTGELGIVEIPRRTSDWSCMGCGTLWRITLPPSAARQVR